MQCTGTVVESRGGFADVLLETTACDHCHACGFGSLSEREPSVVRARNGIGAERDDRVRLEIAGGKVMSASAVLFMVPFCGFMLGFLLGYFPVYWLTGAARVPSALAAAVILLVASYYPVRVLGERFDDPGFVITSLDTADDAGEAGGPPAGGPRRA